MELHQPAARPQSSIHWPSVFQLGFSLVGVLFLWGGALSLAVLGMVQYIGGSGSRLEALALLLMAVGIGLSGALLLPSAGFALARLVGRPAASAPALPRFFQPTLLFLTLPLVLLIGNWASKNLSVAWLLLPILHILAVGLPVLWLAYLGCRDLPCGSPQRSWGVFGSGLVLGPLLILFVELAALLLFLAFAVTWALRDPSQASQLALLAQRLAQGNASPETAVRLLGPYLVRPGVIYSIFAFGAVIVPLIEEAIKPVGVWLLGGRSLTPAEGFTAGILSGAGYALFESLALSSSAEEWAPMVFARMGAAVIHILNTGMVGWALVLAWREGRYLRLAATYLVAVLIHSLWNTMALAAALSELLKPPVGPGELPLIDLAGRVAPYVLVALAVFGFITLLWLNRRILKNQRAEQLLPEGAAYPAPTEP